MAIAVPALALILLLGRERAGRTWDHSPPEPAYVAKRRLPRWNRASVASLALLRRVTAHEARRSQHTLAACEASARRLTTRRRPAAFRRCALAPMSRTGSFASSNSHMLSSLLEEAEATPACRGRVLALSGMTGTLAMISRVTTRSVFDAPWSELLAASRSIRGLARASGKLARAPDLTRACRPRKPAPPAPTGPVA